MKVINQIASGNRR